MLPRLITGLSTLDGVELEHIGTWDQTHPGLSDTNITLVPGYNNAGMARFRPTGWLERASNVQSAWFNETRRGRFLDRATILYDRTQQTLFPLKIAYTNANDEIMMTAGNSVRRVANNDFATGEFSIYAPFLTLFNETRYLIWWDRDERLVIAEAPSSAALINKRQIVTAFDEPDFALQGAFQPTAIEHNGRLFVLSLVGQTESRLDAVRLSSSDDLINWTHRTIELSKAAVPRPVLTALDGRLFVFFSGFQDKTQVRYLSSIDGETWSVERDLPIPTSFDPAGEVGTLGGIGVAPYRDGLAVSWVTDTDFVDFPIYTAMYRIAD